MEKCKKSRHVGPGYIFLSLFSCQTPDCFANPQCVAIIKEKAPNLMKYPIKLFNKKTCGEIFDLVVSKKLVPEDVAKEIEAAINAL